MDNRTRFHRLMSFEPVDRLPVVEWAGWWDKTIERWHQEGLPTELNDAGEIREYLGLDCYRQMGFNPRKASCPSAAGHGLGLVDDLAGYLRLREHLYPDPEHAFDATVARAWAERQARGEMVVWITLQGFFWFPRTILGIHGHLCAFYESPAVMHAINKDILEHNLRMVEAFCAVCTPDYMSFAEDMSYNNGPMISKELFDEFIGPYYRRIVPALKKRGIIPFIDTDGDIAQLIPWFLEVGVDGFFPLERQAGCDIVAYRNAYPRTRYIGAYDKMVMTRGEEAMRGEFERLLPVMQQGGYIPSVDHQTPPGVSLEEYRLYVQLLKEYAGRPPGSAANLRCGEVAAPPQWERAARRSSSETAPTS